MLTDGEGSHDRRHENGGNDTTGDEQIASMTRPVLVLDVELAAHPHWDSDDHGRYSDTSEQRDADRCSNQRAQLPQDLLLATPRFLAPERAARRTESDV